MGMGSAANRADNSVDMTPPGAAPGQAVPDRLRAAILARVSSEAQDRGAVSIPQQLALCRQRAVERGWLVTRVYTDNRAYRSPLTGRMVQPSAKRSDRPGFQQMLGEAGREFDVLVAWRLDRIVRGATTTGMLEDCLDQTGITVELVTQNFDRETLGILGAFGGLELRGMMRRINMGWEGRARKGLHVGGQPRGYDVVRDASGKSVGYEFDSAWRSFFDHLAELFIAGVPLAGIGRRLSPNPETGKAWHQRTLRDMLANPFYRGQIAFGRSRRRPEHIIRAKAVHAPAWTPEVISAIDREFERRRGLGRRGPRNRRWEYLFAGIVRCGICGRPLAAGGGAERYHSRSYHCNRPPYVRSGLAVPGEVPHEPNSISERKLLRQLVALLQYVSDNRVDSMLDVYALVAPVSDRPAPARGLEAMQAELDQHDARLAELQAGMDLVSDHADLAPAAAELIAREIRSVQAQRLQLARAYDAAATSAPPEAPGREALRQRMIALRDYGDLSQMPYSELKQLLRDSLPALWVRGGRLVPPPPFAPAGLTPESKC